MSPQATIQFDSADSPAEPSRPSQTSAVRLPLFRSGTRVSHQGKLCTVNYVVIRRGQLLVNLHETNHPVDADRLFLEPTWLSLRRS